MRVYLILTSLALMGIWLVSLYTFDTGDIVHCFLIGSIVLLLIRIMFYKNNMTH